MRIRLATIDDGELLHAWRNDPETRRQSRSEDPVTWDQHSRWLEGVIESPDHLLLVGEDEKGPVGTVRFDIAAGGAEVSVTVAPERRGQGLSAHLLQLSCERIDLPIYAAVREDNVASIQMVERAGFRFVEEDDGMLRYVLDRR
jgi:RimJ/RimL family protein N-acetyltransferase